MNLNDFIKNIISLYENEYIDDNSLLLMQNKALELIYKLKDNSISENELNALDEYIEYLKVNNLNIEIISKYQNVAKYLEEQNSLNNYREPKKIKPINNDGLISAITIIYVTIILGLTSALILVALFKK